MRQIRIWAVMLLAVTLAAACVDAPTAPMDNGSSAGELGQSSDHLSSCCDPVIVIVPGPEECDPYQSLDWCEGGGDVCMTSQTGAFQPEYYTTSGCPDRTGGGPGGGTTPPPGGTPPGGGTPSPPEPPTTEPPPDTCNTGDQTVDDPAVQEAFAHLWSNSNYGPGVPMSHRIEDGGWIIRNTDGNLRFMSFPVSYSRDNCSISIPEGVIPPPGTVAWVHTHPFAAGERLTECQLQPIPGVGLVPLSYQNQSSAADDEIQAQWRSQGFNIVAYMIDANGIVRYDGSGTPAGETKYSRCGY